MSPARIAAIPFARHHGLSIRLQAAQRGSQDQLEDPETLLALEREQSFSFVDERGAVLACAGLIDLAGWGGQRKFAWALLADRPGAASLLRITRAIGGYLDCCPARRIETSVDCGFAAGVIWARRLGFACEGRMRAFGFDGRDHYLFARTR